MIGEREQPISGSKPGWNLALSEKELDPLFVGLWEGNANSFDDLKQVEFDPEQAQKYREEAA